MAMENRNDSYNRCMTELRARYRGRGIAVNAKNGAAAQEAREAERMLQAQADSCLYFDRASGISDVYRSGEHKGSKYMTSEDFIRYFHNRRTVQMPSALVARQQAMAAKAKQNNTAVVSGRNARGAGNTALTASDGSGKEGHLKTRVETFVKKWFPVEVKQGRTVEGKIRFPMKAVGSMAAFALSLGLIVSGSVMIGSASGELGTLNSEIDRLEAKQSDLQSQLDMKYNIQDIEEDAKSLGMINREFAEDQYLEVGADEDIEIYEQEENNVGLSTLLSAFGIELD